MRPSIFEDETDIFADMPTTSKPHVPKPKKEIKQKERKSLVPSDTGTLNHSFSLNNYKKTN